MEEVYLQCGNCGHQNPIDSEYLVFCKSCGKKMENNYPEWKKRHQDSSLEDYKGAIGQKKTEEVVARKPDIHSRSIRTWILLTLCLIIGGVGGKFIGAMVYDEFFSGSDESISSEEWQRKSYGELGLSLELPFEMEAFEPPFPEEMQAMIKQAEAFQGNVHNKFYVTTVSMKYADFVNESALESAALGSVNEMKRAKDVADFEYDQENISLEGIPGIIQRGSFLQQGVKASFISASYMREHDYFMVNIVIPGATMEGDDMAERVVKSIRL